MRLHRYAGAASIFSGLPFAELRPDPRVRELDKRRAADYIFHRRRISSIEPSGTTAPRRWE
jgi:hypothetical protein